MFSLNTTQLSKKLLPPFHRQAKVVAWLTALLRPLVDLFAVFTFYRLDTMYKLAFTGQIIYLEKLLNDQFNSGFPAYTNGLPTGIYITDPVFTAPFYLWRKVELRPPVYLRRKSEGKPPVYMRRKSELNGQYDFIVHVPIQVGNVLTDQVLVARIKAWIEIYRVAGSEYKIVNYIP